VRRAVPASGRKQDIERDPATGRGQTNAIAEGQLRAELRGRRDAPFDAHAADAEPAGDRFPTRGGEREHRAGCDDQCDTRDRDARPAE
jgi:hypothetical protein